MIIPYGQMDYLAVELCLINVQFLLLLLFKVLIGVCGKDTIIGIVSARGCNCV